MRNRARDDEDGVKESSDEESDPTSSNETTAGSFSGDDLQIASEED